MASEQQVREYWEQNPLLAHEVTTKDPIERWHYLDHIKRSDVEAFAMHYWKFEQVAGKTLLDLGCGPGWLSVMYARGGAKVTAIDITNQALILTKAALDVNGLSANLRQASAESLPLSDQSFDVVVSSGVLHHTPDPSRAFSEAHRVARRGALGLVTLYRIGILHHPLVFPVVRFLMRVSGARHPGADLGRESTSVADFVRQYDGAENPVGIAKKESDWALDLVAAGWEVVSVERHYFPARMVPPLRHAPRWVRRIADKHCATMVYFTLRRSDAVE
jgi:SAM-dependent methyltransferase